MIKLLLCFYAVIWSVIVLNDNSLDSVIFIKIAASFAFSLLFSVWAKEVFVVEQLVKGLNLSQAHLASYTSAIILGVTVSFGLTEAALSLSQ